MRRGSIDLPNQRLPAPFCMHQQQGSDGRGLVRIGTGKGGMGEKLIREQNHLGGAWSNAADRHGGTRREQTSTALKGKTREMAQLWMVLPVLQAQRRWDVAKPLGPRALGCSACRPARESDQPQSSYPNINTKFPGPWV